MAHARLKRCARSLALRSCLFSERAALAGYRVELYGAADRKRLGLTVGTSESVRTHIDDEVAFGETGAIARYPRFAEHFATSREDLRGERAIDVAAIDRELRDRAASAIQSNVRLQIRHGLCLWPR